ncbi:hypothetical protein ADUPG1_013196 [Aduncisulcus paluster]|uniref:Uncharacterized protein n=1 Tax=Aduncisulcus paluster TaxID=2918883 RepID=A0ABQ5K2M3_9EUKA|nr:hypothetical protein ADUPG1_013196 [Aduncisulcus paluster]
MNSSIHQKSEDDKRKLLISLRKQVINLTSEQQSLSHRLEEAPHIIEEWKEANEKMKRILGQFHDICEGNMLYAKSLVDEVKDQRIETQVSLKLEEDKCKKNLHDISEAQHLKADCESRMKDIEQSISKTIRFTMGLKAMKASSKLKDRILKKNVLNMWRWKTRVSTSKSEIRERTLDYFQSLRRKRLLKIYFRKMREKCAYSRIVSLSEEANVQDVQEELSALLSSIEKNTSDISTLSSDISSVRSEIEGLTTLSGQTAISISKDQESVELLQISLNEKEELVKHAEERVSNLRRQLSALEEEGETSHSAERVLSSKHALRRHELNEALKKYHDDIETIEHDMYAKKISIAKLKGEHSALSKRMAHTEQGIHSLGLYSTKLKDCTSRASDSISSFLRRTQGEVTRMERALEHRLALIKQFKTRMKATKESISKGEELADAAEKRTERLDLQRIRIEGDYQKEDVRKQRTHSEYILSNRLRRAGATRCGEMYLHIRDGRAILEAK